MLSKPSIAKETCCWVRERKVRPVNDDAQFFVAEKKGVELLL
jgi:hypothetical protein